MLSGNTIFFYLSNQSSLLGFHIKLVKKMLVFFYSTGPRDAILGRSILDGAALVRHFTQIVHRESRIPISPRPFSSDRAQSRNRNSLSLHQDYSGKVIVLLWILSTSYDLLKSLESSTSSYLDGLEEREMRERERGNHFKF